MAQAQLGLGVFAIEKAGPSSNQRRVHDETQFIEQSQRKCRGDSARTGEDRDVASVFSLELI